jgi:hypothetical protein
LTFEKLIKVNYKNITYISFRDTSFAFVTLFEYLYPLSTFCESAAVEVWDDTVERMKILFKTPIQILENFYRKLGTILMNFITLNDCFTKGNLDGKCSGTKFGTGCNYLLLLP